MTSLAAFGPWSRVSMASSNHVTTMVIMQLTIENGLAASLQEVSTRLDRHTICGVLGQIAQTVE